jgi:hypothetical protein
VLAFTRHTPVAVGVRTLVRTRAWPTAPRTALALDAERAVAQLTLLVQFTRAAALHTVRSLVLACTVHTPVAVRVTALGVLFTALTTSGAALLVQTEQAGGGALSIALAVPCAWHVVWVFVNALFGDCVACVAVGVSAVAALIARLTAPRPTVSDDTELAFVFRSTLRVGAASTVAGRVSAKCQQTNQSQEHELGSH